MEQIKENYPRFLTTKDVMKILKIGNRTCLELFHRENFPCIKIGRAYKITDENFKEYFKIKRISKNE